jgi:hypothetical protein
MQARDDVDDVVGRGRGMGELARRVRGGFGPGLSTAGADRLG